MRCPIRAHGHGLQPVGRVLTQDGTDSTAQPYECPSGLYSWLIIDGRMDPLQAPSTSDRDTGQSAGAVVMATDISRMEDAHVEECSCPAKRWA
jgi:hypothetical protein